MISAHYHNLDKALDESWRLMEEGVTNRRHGFHNGVAATIGLDGRPRARTVILRSANRNEHSLVFHTDVRSQKIIELKSDPRLSMHFYDVTSKAQIRIDGVAHLHIENAFAHQRWDISQAMSRMCYSIQPAPGTPVEHADGYSIGNIETTLPQSLNKDFDNFAAVEVRVTSLEWLFLAREGHRRALFKWTENDRIEQSWLVP